MMQMTKLAIIPFTVMLETLFLKKQFRLVKLTYIRISTLTDIHILICVLWACSDKIKISLSILLLGVGIASVTDLQLNLVGTILSLIAILTTCIGQIVCIYLNFLHKSSYYISVSYSQIPLQLTNTIQKRLNVSSTQLLYQSSPFQAAILFVIGPFLDQCLTGQNVFAYTYSPGVMVFIKKPTLAIVARILVVVVVVVKFR